MNDEIVIRGLRQNNLKNVSLNIPKNKIVVFTGVSGSGKSSIVFDTVAAESQRQMNETYSAWVRGRLPKYDKPKVELIENLSASVIVDQSRLGGNSRSTVGTISDMYASLRLLFSRIGKPHIGTASYFSFNDPNGMCPKCSGLGKVMKLDLEARLDPEKSWNEGMADLPAFHVGNWYWKKYKEAEIFPLDKKYKDFTQKEKNRLLYGADEKGGKQIDKQVEGIETYLSRMLLRRDTSELKEASVIRLTSLLHEEECPMCRGRRLNRMALVSKINGYTITDMTAMELTALRRVLLGIYAPGVQNVIDSLVLSLTRMIDIGLQYLSMDRESSTLSGGEAQRLKLVRYMGSSLTGMTYIFDEPSTGMHPRDVYRMVKLLKSLRDKGNTVLVVEHDKDIISIADEVIDVGPLAGVNGGEIMFQGSYESLLISDTLTGRAMNTVVPLKERVRVPKDFLPIRNACVHNLKNIDVDIPLNVLTVVTGVAGSGKSSLIRDVFAKTYEDEVILVDQSAITATNRSTPVTFLGVFDEIRALLAKENGVKPSLFSFNSDGACPACAGRGFITTELVFMDPVVTKCESCDGRRYSKNALSYTYKNKNIVEILDMTAKEALEFFAENRKLRKALESLCEVGLSYITLGQPASTLSGGERQRLKLAKYLDKKGNIYVLDEPTTGLHASDTEKLMELFEHMVSRGSTVIIIEHNLDVIKRADYIIDIGPDGGRFGGEVVFAGSAKKMLEASETITAKCLRLAVNNKALTEAELEELTRVEETDGDIPLVKAENEEEDGMKLNEIGHAECYNGDYRIVLERQYTDGLKGLEGFSHLQIIWWFNGCDNAEDRSVLTVEKPYTKGPDTLGTFATRSPERPNPIAVSTCEVKRIDREKGIIELCYFDAFTGTPILDIKPYTPSVDKVEKPSVPVWCAHWPKSYETSEDFNWEKEFNF